MFFKLFPFFRKKATFIQINIEVRRYAKGTRRYEARPITMLVRDKEISFEVEDFIAYGRTQRGARKRCLEKTVPYLNELAKIHEE